jgi:transposase InsO family protein
MVWIACSLIAAAFCGGVIGFCLGCRPRAALLVENLVLRRQIALLAPLAKCRPKITPLDRFLLAWVCHLWPAVKGAVVIVKPETLVRWHREFYRLFWRWKSRSKGGRPKIDRALIALIDRMSRQNPLWGAPRIHGELKRLGFDIAESTVAKYMDRRGRGSGGQRWTTFLRDHAREIAAIDMLTVPTLAFDTLYVFVVLGLGRRKILHVEVTAHPTALWLARQVTEAFPWDTAPRFLVRDNDGAYGKTFRRRLSAMGIRDKPVAPHSPWQNGYAERVIGSIRRECLDHVIVLGPTHLRRVLREYADYYNNDRTHLGLDKDTPNSRELEREGSIVSRPILGGLRHRYSRK